MPGESSGCLISGFLYPETVPYDGTEPGDFEGWGEGCMDL